MFRLLSGYLAAALVAGCATPPASLSPTIRVADLHSVAGAGWTGRLIYRDYSPPFGEVELEVEAKVTALADGISLALHYPREPDADSESKLLISEAGLALDGKPVVGREISGDSLIIATQADCEDDNQPATCRHVYTIAPTAFGWTKLVTLDSDGNQFQRNAYAFTRP